MRKIFRFCVKHQDYFPVENFYLSSSGYYSSYCKSCQKKISRDRYRNDPHVREQQKEYIQNLPNKEEWQKNRYLKRRVKRLKYYQDNREKIKAQNLARYYERKNDGLRIKT